jgi:hypothetical protein
MNAEGVNIIAAAVFRPSEVAAVILPTNGALDPRVRSAVLAVRACGADRHAIMERASLTAGEWDRVTAAVMAGPPPLRDLLPESAPEAPVLTTERLILDDALHPPREEFVLGSMIPFGKASVLFGPSSVGKSAAAAQMMFAFAAGADGLWGLPLYPGGGPALVYTAEDSLDDWRRKAAAIHRDGSIDVVRAMTRLHIIDKSDGVARLSEVVTVRALDTTRRVAQPTAEQDALILAALGIGARFLLVETASRLVEDEDNANMSALQSALGRIARETGAAVLTTHHPTKAASKDNDDAVESARGGGAFTMNARNVLSLFPAKPEAAKPYADRFPSDDLVTLTHGKPTSSTRAHAPIVLVRCDAVHGAVLRLPDEVALSPEQAQRNTKRVEQDRQREWEQLRHLYAKVEDFLQSGPVSRFMLHQRHGELGLPRDAVYPLVEVALARGTLTVATRNKRGITLGLGPDPRRAINGDPVPDVSGESSP